MTVFGKVGSHAAAGPHSSEHEPADSVDIIHHIGRGWRPVKILSTRLPFWWLLLLMCQKEVRHASTPRRLSPRRRGTCGNELAFSARRYSLQRRLRATWVFPGAVGGAYLALGERQPVLLSLIRGPDLCPGRFREGVPGQPPPALPAQASYSSVLSLSFFTCNVGLSSLPLPA